MVPDLPPSRAPAGRRPALFAALASLFVLLLVGAATLVPRSGTAPLVAEPAPSPPSESAAEVAAPDAGPTPPPTPAQRLYFGTGQGALTRFSLVRRFNAPIEPVDTRTFAADGVVAMIADIETPAVQAVCQSDEKTLWGCGLMVRAALFNRIRKGVLACRPLDQPDALGMPRAAGWHCLHDGEDVALWMIRTGWARPLPGSPIAYWQAAQQARAARNGAWNGEWNILRQSVPLAPAQDIAPPPSGARVRSGRR